MRITSLGILLAATLLPSIAEANDSVDNYRSFSFGLLSGMDLMLGTGSVGSGISGLAHSPTAARATGLVGLNVNPRLVIAGFQLGGQFGMYFNEGIDTVFVPGGNLGYVIGIVGPFALTPSARALFLVPTRSGTSASMQLTGELALQWFWGKNGFLEPYFAVGALHQTGPNQALFLIGGGYRLGVVF